MESSIPLILGFSIVLSLLYMIFTLRSEKRIIEKQKEDILNYQKESDKLDKLKQKLDSKSREIYVLKTSLRSANNTIQDLKTRLSDICFVRDENAKKAVNKFKEELSKLERELAKYKSEKQDVVLAGKLKAQELKDECKKLEDLKAQEVEELNNLLTKSKRTINKLNYKLSLLKQEKEELIIEFNKEKQNLESERDKYKKTLIKLKNLIESRKAAKMKMDFERSSKEQADNLIEDVNNVDCNENRKDTKVVRKNIKKGKRIQTYNRKSADNFECYPEWSDDSNPHLGAYKYNAINDVYDKLNTSFEQYDQGEVEELNEFLFDQDN